MKFVWYHTVLVLALLQVSGADGSTLWKSHVPAYMLNDIALHQNEMWGATDGGVIRWKMPEMQFERFISDDGLIGNGVTTIAVSGSGTVWAGTKSGLSRFDGKSWKTFTVDNGLTGNEILDLAVYNDEVWAATSAGISWFDGQAWRRYTAADGLPFDRVEKISMDSHRNIWICSSKSVARLQNGTWEVMNPTGGITGGVSALMVEGDGTVFVGLYAYTTLKAAGGTTMPPSTYTVPMLFRYADGSWKQLAGAAELGLLIISSICVGKDDEIFVGLRGEFSWSSGGLRVFDGTSWRELFIRGSDNVPQAVALALAPDNTLWASVNRPERSRSNYFLSHYSGGGWQEYRISCGPPDSRPYYAVSADLNGNVWAGGDGGGPGFHNGSVWHDYTYELPLNKGDTATIQRMVVTPDNSLWVASWGAGVLHYSDNRWTRYSTIDGLPDNDIRDIAAASVDDIWIVMLDKGLGHFHHGVWEFISATRDGLSLKDATTIAVGNDGDVWVGTWGKGVLRYDGASWSTFMMWGGGESQNLIGEITAGPDGTIWVGTYGGLFRYDGYGWASFSRNVPKGITSITVGSAGDIWIGTCYSEGVTHFDGTVWKTFTVKDGLLSDIVYDLSVAPDNTLWIAANNGISQYRSSDGTFVHGRSDGPSSFSLGNFPNPFNAATRIELNLPHPDVARLDVFSLTGQKIDTILNASLPSGYHSVIWDASGFATGVYFCKLNVRDTVKIRKMLLVK